MVIQVNFKKGHGIESCNLKELPALILKRLGKKVEFYNIYKDYTNEFIVTVCDKSRYYDCLENNYELYRDRGGSWFHEWEIRKHTPYDSCKTNIPDVIKLVKLIEIEVISIVKHFSKT